MKTRFLAMMLALVGMLTAGAQSLTSHEGAAETEAFKGATVTIMTSFDDDGTCTMLMFMDQEIEKAVPGMKKQFLSMVSDYSDLQVSRLTSSEMVTNIGTFKGLPRGSMEKMLSD